MLVSKQPNSPNDRMYLDFLNNVSERLTINAITTRAVNTICPLVYKYSEFHIVPRVTIPVREEINILKSIGFSPLKTPRLISEGIIVNAVF